MESERDESNKETRSKEKTKLNIKPLNKQFDKTQDEWKILRTKISGLTSTLIN